MKIYEKSYKKDYKKVDRKKELYCLFCNEVRDSLNNVIVENCPNCDNYLYSANVKIKNSKKIGEERMFIVTYTLKCADCGYIYPEIKTGKFYTPKDKLEIKRYKL